MNMSIQKLLRAAVATVGLVCFTITTAWGQARPISIEIDARDLPRKLLSATLRIPVEASTQSQVVALWYPKWVPGSHGPGGPIANVAGLTFTSLDGDVLNWTRTPGEVYRVELQVPPNTTEIEAQIRYIANQPTTNSMGHDTFGGSMVGLISPGTVLLCPEGQNPDESLIQTKLLLPKGWHAAAAMQSKADDVADQVSFAPTSIQNFVDSPIMCGRYHRAFQLDTKEAQVALAPHMLHVFSEYPQSVDLDKSIVECLQRMVAQTAKLTGSQPFDHFDILLAVTDQMPSNGLEHSRSTMNVLPPNSLRSLGSLKGWSRLLIPHEYLHSWCGKYRRPVGMVVNDFHTPMGTDLLWVYEGLTQYLGELVEARCGLMSKDEFCDRVGVELRNAVHQQNRQWRPLVDTGAASHVLRDGSPAWPKLRGSQDYYMEGMLFWLEADAIIRTQTNGQRSLDDFCKAFFACTDPAANWMTSKPKAFTRQEIVETLNSIAAYDWDGLILRRVESTRESYDPKVAELLGYEFKASAQRPRISPATFRLPSGIDHYDTLGMMLSGDGSITDIRLNSPADKAKLGPGMKIAAIDDRKWSREVLDDAVQRSASSSAINLLVEEGYLMKPVQLQYFDGPKYLSLSRDESKPDMLEKILKRQ